MAQHDETTAVGAQPEQVTEPRSQSEQLEEQPQPTRRRSLPARIAPLVVVVVLLVAAFAVASRPTPGRTTSTQTTASMVVSTSAPEETAEYPIALREGGDALHESAHVFEAFHGVEGVADATLDWSGGVVLRVAQQIASIVASTGYLAAPAQ